MKSFQEMISYVRTLLFEDAPNFLVFEVNISSWKSIHKDDLLV